VACETCHKLDIPLLSIFIHILYEVLSLLFSSVKPETKSLCNLITPLGIFHKCCRKRQVLRSRYLSSASSITDTSSSPLSHSPWSPSPSPTPPPQSQHNTQSPSTAAPPAKTSSRKLKSSTRSASTFPPPPPPLQFARSLAQFPTDGSGTPMVLPAV
jgi:hypothetical protein